MKMKAKKTLSVLLTLSLFFTITVCGLLTISPQSCSAAPAIGMTRNISLGGGVSGGTFAVLGAGMAKILSDHINGLSVTCEGTSGSVEACKLIGEHELAFTLSASDAFYNASKGQLGFKGNKIDNIRLVMGGYDAPFHVIVRAESPYRRIADLKGKRITCSAGNTAEYQLPIIMAAHGISRNEYTTVPLTQAEGAAALKDGNVDAIIQTTGIGSSGYVDLTTTTACRFLSIDEDIIKAINKEYPYMTRSVITAGSYRLQTEEFPTVTTTNFLIADANTQEEIVYAATKVLHLYQSELADIHPMGAQFTPKFTIENLIIELHPGAERYYREIGILK